jgi:hypothetical protein
MKMAKRSPLDVSFENIKDYCLNPDDCNLTDKEKELHARWNYIDDQIRKYGTSKESYSMIKIKYPDLSRAQIMRDMSMTKRLFSSTYLIDKEYYRRWLIEDIMLHIKNCKAANDRRNWKDSHSNLIKAIGLDKEDKEIDPEKLEQHNYYMIANFNGVNIKLDLTQMHKLPETMRSVLLNLNDEMTEETAYQLLTPNAEGSETE